MGKTRGGTLLTYQAASVMNGDKPHFLSGHVV
jgi:hypothetical protein